MGDEPGYVAMGGQSEAITTVLRKGHRNDLELPDALRLAVSALASVGGENNKPRTLSAAQLEVAVLERDRPGRAFRRIVGAALDALMAEPEPPAAEPASKAKTKANDDPAAGPDGATSGEGARAPDGE